MHACSVTQSCLTLRDPMDSSPPDSSVHGVLQARTTGVGCHALLQGIFRISPVSPALSGRFFTTEPLGKLCLHLKNILKMLAELYSFKSSRKSVSLSFQLLEATCILWSIDHSSVLKASNTGPSPSHVAISLVLSLPPLSSIFKDPDD